MSITLSADAGAKFLAPYKLPLVPQTLVETGAEAAEVAVSLGEPVALKLIAEGLSHKSDAGGVRLGLKEPDEVRRVADELLSIGRKLGDPMARVMVQPMIRGVAELIVGIGDDPTFGPVIAVGLGGTLTELFKDIAIGIPPLSRSDANKLLEELRSSVLLDGFRGGAPADREAVVDVILEVSRMALEGKVKELDLNPIIVRERGKGCIVVDNRVVLAERAEQER